MDEVPLSGYGAASSRPAPIGRMMASFAADFRDGVDINLGVGYVNERTIPRRAIQEATREVLSQPERYRLALNYGGPAGSPNLIRSLRRYLLERSVGGLTPEVLDRCRIIVGPSGATSLLEGIARVVEPGIVLTADPVYYIYCNFLERAGFEVLAVPEDERGVRPERLEAALASLGRRKSDVRFFYLVTISNPTCTILANERRRAVVAAAARLSRELGRKVPVFLDRAYEDLIHDPEAEPPRSALLDDQLGLVYEIGTLSKVLAPALRVGYMVGRDGPFLRAMVQRTSDVGFSAPLITQEIASYLLDHHVADQLARVNEGYHQKARRVAAWIDERLGEFLERRSGGQAGFYFYLTFREVETTEGSPFFRYLARTTGQEEIDGPPGRRNPRVVYLPGEFCVHPKGELVQVGRRQLRLSYGYEELDKIGEALAYMRQAADFARSHPAMV